MHIPISRPFIFILILLMASCTGDVAEDKGPVYGSERDVQVEKKYRLAIHPLHNISKQIQSYEPLVRYLERNIQGMRFELETFRDYRAYEARIRSRGAEFLLPNPWQTLEAMKVGYSVMAMAGDARDFKGIFLVRKDSAIRTPQDLKGRKVSFPAPTAVAACILPQYFLHKKGINILRDIDIQYVGTQESSIAHVLLGQADAGATWPPPWRAYQKDHPQEAAQLKVIWETPTLLNNSVMVRDDVPAGIRQRVQDLILRLDGTKEGLDILLLMETARFHAADNASYGIVREFIQRFEREVRPVEVH